MDRELIEYFPQVLKDVREFKSLAQAEQPEVSVLWDAIDTVLNDQFVMDATINGVMRWEKILKIVPKATDSLAVRKSRIMAKLNDQLPYTYTTLKQRIESLCGINEYILTVDNAAYMLNVWLSFAAKDNLDTVSAMLDRIVPANIRIHKGYFIDQRYLKSQVYYGHLSRMAVSLSTSQPVQTRKVTQVCSQPLFITGKSDTGESINFVQGSDMDVALYGQTVQNTLSNSGFENGMTGWLGAFTSSAAKYRSGIKSTMIINDGSGAYSAVQRVSGIAGDKFYVSLYCMLTDNPGGSNNALYINCANAAGSMGLGQVNCTPSLLNQWQRLSVIVTIPTGDTSFLYRFYSYRTACTVYVDDCVCVNLTKDFGAGNEPSQAWCDANIGYFDSTLSVINPVVRSVGKNLFDGEVEIGNIVSATGALTNDTTRARAKNYNVFIGTLQHTVIAPLELKLGSIVYYDANKIFISGVGLGGAQTSVVTPPSTALFYKLTFYRVINTENITSDDLLNLKNGAQLELGSTATTYEPYKYTDLAVTGTLRSVADTDSLENKLSYDPSTWASWGIYGSGASKVADSTGIEITVGTVTTILSKSLTVEPNTKYVLIYEILSGDFSKSSLCLNLNYCAFASPLILPNNIGANKVVLTTLPSITYQSFALYFDSATAGTKYKFKYFALYKINSSQMNADAINMTAAQFVAKYPFFANNGLYLTGTISQDRLYKDNDKWYIDRWVNEDGSKKPAMTTEDAIVSGKLVAYKGRQIQVLSPVIPKMNLTYLQGVL